MKKKIEIIYSSPLERAFLKTLEKNDGSGYSDLFTQTDVGTSLSMLITSLHSTQISIGTKLENIIYDEYKGNKYKNVDFFDVFDYVKSSKEDVLFKRVTVTKEILNLYGFEYSRNNKLTIDFLLVKNNWLYVFELKKGKELDAVKSNGEVEKLVMLKEFFNKTTNLITMSNLVLWSCDNILDASIKVTNSNNFILLGKNFSSILRIDYDKINNILLNSSSNNEDFFFEKINELILKRNQSKYETTL